MTQRAVQKLTVADADPLGHAAKRLLQLMCAEAKRRYPEEWPPGAPMPRNQALQPRLVFLVARIDNRVVGCGGVRPIEEDVAELRRMYVLRRSRRRGVARLLLQQLERRAQDLDFRVMRLATGTRQPEAIELYKKAGYARIESIGEHVRDAYAVCYQKFLLGPLLGTQHREQSARRER